MEKWDIYTFTTPTSKKNRACFYHVIRGKLWKFMAFSEFGGIR